MKRRYWIGLFLPLGLTACAVVPAELSDRNHPASEAGTSAPGRARVSTLNSDAGLSIGTETQPTSMPAGADHEMEMGQSMMHGGMGSPESASPAASQPSSKPVDSAHEMRMDGGMDHGKGPEVLVDYTCPMHPEVIQDEPGSCPKCGMTLKRVDKTIDREGGSHDHR